MRVTTRFLPALVVSLSLGGMSVAHAIPITIDNGTMKPATGGSCSACSTLDFPDWINYDDLSLASDSVLDSIDFEITLHSIPPGSDISGVDFQVDIWDPTRTTNFLTSSFVGADALASASIGSRTYFLSFDLGNGFLAAGDYIIGVAADFGSHVSSSTGYIPGPASDGTYRQWQAATNSFPNVRQGDLPFRLHINDDKVVSVPEPSTLALFGLGLAGVAFIRRRKLT